MKLPALNGGASRIAEGFQPRRKCGVRDRNVPAEAGWGKQGTEATNFLARPCVLGYHLEKMRRGKEVRKKSKYKGPLSTGIRERLRFKIDAGQKSLHW